MIQYQVIVETIDEKSPLFGTRRVIFVSNLLWLSRSVMESQSRRKDIACWVEASLGRIDFPEPDN